jgi:hypothetical protein
MIATELKALLEAAIDDGIIKCKEINSLRCPAKGYPLIAPDWCNVSDPALCDKTVCTHRLHITYADKSDPNFLDVRYMIPRGVKTRGVRVGYINDTDEQLVEVRRKIDR